MPVPLDKERCIVSRNPWGGVTLTFAYLGKLVHHEFTKTEALALSSAIDRLADAKFGRGSELVAHIAVPIEK